MSKESMKELLINTLVILLITLVAGGVLGVVNEMTKGPIAIMEAEKIKEANRAVFPDAANFSDNILDVSKMEDCLSGQYDGVDITEVLEAYNASGEFLGYVFEITTHEGYGGDIVFRIGLQPDGTSNAISITSISETAGLGMRAEEVIVPQFAVNRADHYEVVKGDRVFDNQIKAISSATITSKAIVNGVNAGLTYLKEVLGGGVANE